MKEDFITFKIAQKLKKKGFDKECYAYYRESGILSVCTTKYNSNSLSNEFSAPTISQVLKWLRNTRKLFISPCVITDYQDDFHRDTTYWSFIVVNIESGDSIYREYERVTEKRYETYEEAALAGIEYVLDNLIYDATGLNIYIDYEKTSINSRMESSSIPKGISSRRLCRF